LHHVSSEPEPIAHTGSEMLVLWQRALATNAGEAEALAWRKQVDTRIQVAGGEVIARAGSSVCAAFDPLELEDAIDLALGLARDAQAQGARIEVASAIALGELVPAGEPEAPAGSVIDRAQLLAHAAEAFEIVLDEAAHARAQDIHLFGRALRAGTLGAHAIDRDHPLKRDARAALAAVLPARLPPGARAAFERLRALSSLPGPRRIGLRVLQPHVALFWLDELAREMQPGLVLRLGPQAAGLQPLGGMQLALRRAGQALEPLLDAPLRAVITRIIAGATVARGDAVLALRELLERAAASGERTFIVLDRLRDIDRPSLAVVAEALQQACGDPMLFLIADEHEGIPSALLRAGEHDDIALEPLALDDRTHVAENSLGLPPGSDLARRVARLGGDTTLGVWAAARTLVGSGDLVRGAVGFAWRTKARHASLALPIEALLMESATGLEPAARRVLEALCVAAPSASLAIIREVAALDGLTAELADQGIAQLVREGWIDTRGELGPLEAAVCNAMRNGMPPARAAELHRFVADVLQAQPAFAERPSFASALLAHHASEGGRDQAAAAALLDAAQAATASGFERMAVRLAANALKLDASAEIKQRARSVARSIDTGPMSSSLPPRAPTEPPEPVPSAAPIESGDPRTIASSAMRSAIRAIVRRESESAESLIDTAVAAGWGRAGAQRLWSIAQLAKGDLPHAVRVLKQAHVPGGNPGTRSREAIAAALILLEAGECMDAVRSALEALASARRASETRGERAALELLAACYQQLGREPDAERNARAAATR
jgi:hypothetical protein